MKTISQRELRNKSGEVMRGLSQGQSYRVTSRGALVGVLHPASRTTVDEMTLRRGTQDMDFPAGIRVSERTEDVLAELKGDR